jgi:crotonobetainyl-CoA:carnitine CoA-transferase CaiB-like acyl-CoA transferase
MTAPGPLAGIKVIELATVIAGPGSGKYLADFGAEVIKVEPPGGDPTRRMGWTGPGETDSYFWKLVNRNKSVITLDLKNADARQSLWALLADADVLIENMRPGKLEALGFDCSEMLKRNPRLVVLRVSGFGQDGPYAQHPGFATIADALTGFAALLGEPDGPPLLPPIAVTDEVTALAGAFAALAAVRHAERTGEGQVVDVNLLESMFQIMGPLVSAYAHMGYVQPRLGSGIPYSVPRGTYRCADGKWVAISTSADSIAARVLDLIGLGGDERFASFQNRSKNREVLETYVRDWVAERPSEDVIREFRRVDAAIAPVLDMADIFRDPHYLARGIMTGSMEL